MDASPAGPAGKREESDFSSGSLLLWNLSSVALSESDLDNSKAVLHDTFTQTRVTPGIPVRDEFL